MLDLISKISDEDKQKISNYISLHGIRDGYIGNEKWLSHWATNKKKIFHLFGGQLQVRKHVCFEKDEEVLKVELQKFADSSGFLAEIRDLVMNMDHKYNLSCYFNMMALWDGNAIKNDKFENIVKVRLPFQKKMLQIQKGMKPMRIYPKVIEYFSEDEREKNLLLKEFEQFRIGHSMILNNKKLEGDLVLSIHPLDYMTMSDNASNWSSCMSWVTDGCYRQGTIEMMNSNNAIIAYLNNNKEYDFSCGSGMTNCTWNNKQWRTLLFFTKDIIVTGKNYPYQHEGLAKAALEFAEALAEDSLGWTYQFGPELYQDMIHIDSLDEMENNKEWICAGDARKHNIIFDTQAMYNDFLNDNNTHYWCIRNKVKRNRVVSLSGKCNCLACNSSLLIENEWYEGYNDRYIDTNRVLCYDCYDEKACDHCGVYSVNDNYYMVNGIRYCETCAAMLATCPCCGKTYVRNDWAQSFVYLPRVDISTLYKEDFEPYEYPVYEQDVNGNGKIEFPDYTDKLAYLAICPNCKYKLDEKGILETKQFPWRDNPSDLLLRHTGYYRVVVKPKYFADEDITKYYLSNVTLKNLNQYRIN